jgi:hypothetical protein
MPKNISVIVYPIKGRAKAVAFYTAFLGTKPYVENEYYIGYKVGDQEVGLDLTRASDRSPIST